MKKAIVALSVFAFVFALSGESVKALTGDQYAYSISLSGEKDPKADGTKKSAKADKKSSSCASSCSDKSAKASGDCSSKKTTTADAKSCDDKK